MLSAPLVDGFAELIFNSGPVDSVHRTERYDSAIWHSIVHVAVLDTFQVEVEWVLEVHESNHYDAAHELGQRLVVAPVQKCTDQIPDDSSPLDVPETCG